MRPRFRLPLWMVLMRTELQASNRADLRLSGCAYVVCLLALTLTMASCGDAMPGGDNVAGDGLGAGANGDLGVVVNDSATVDVTTDGATDAGKLDVSERCAETGQG